MKFVISLFAITVIFLLASLFGTVNAVEVHKNGFGGITPFNTTGLTVFNDSLKRSFDYESDSLVLSAEFSILETNGDIRDFSLFDSDLTLQNSSSSPEPVFVDSTFRTSLETGQTPGFYNETVLADAYTLESLPDSNDGGATTFDVRSSDIPDDRYAFLIWNLSSISQDAIILDAQMFLYKTLDTGSNYPRTYDAGKVSASWTELGITWNTQPGITGGVVSITVTTTDGYYSWNITDFVQDWVDGTQTNYGVRIKDQNGGDIGDPLSEFNSREGGGNFPYLEITIQGGQWADASHSETLDMENTNVSLVWWGQIRQTGVQYITGKGCSSDFHVYGIYVEVDLTITAILSDNACSSDTIKTNLPNGGLNTNRTYGIGVVFEDNLGGADVHLWLDGEWIYNETSTKRVGDNGAVFYVGRSSNSNPDRFCNCTHDEILVFKERLDNNTMKLLTTKQHDIVIRSGPGTTTQGFGGLFFALPWLIVFGLLGWLFYVIFLAWKEPFTRE